MAHPRTSIAPQGDAPATENPSAPTRLALALGARIRHARILRGYTLKSLGQATDCTEGMLSKIERGLASPSLSLLHRIAQAFQTNIAELTSVEEMRHSPVVRAGERPVVEFGEEALGSKGIRLERLVPPQRGQLLQGDIHVLPPGASADERIQHQGEEMGYVLEGALTLTVDDTNYLLQAGDSFYFASEQPHSYSNPGSVTTRVLWINSPPTF
ncbi:cupin domain-containing protein [Noviherbaspirillum aerium]|uniref:cupin domain-containing protein n=1 Tax=Noviherbaspirillum aerium TaxID=2588497 RepID=UPI00124CCAC2|nr:cupin domain-containing protein [Noviherbaspirillum aerium]